MTKTLRIDGTRIASTLMERIASEDNVGSSLSERTKAEYTRIMSKLLASSGKATTGSTQLQMVVAAIKSQIESSKISQAHARLLKSAALYWIADEAQGNISAGGSVADHEIAYREVRETPVAHLELHGSRTSGRKAKEFSKKVLASVEQYAATTHTPASAQRLLAFLNANLLVGLRPAEWFNASLCVLLSEQPQRRGQNPPIALVVHNAKSTQGRANGAEREIVLHGISTTQLATILHWHQIITDYVSKFPKDTAIEVIADRLYESMQRTLNYALKKTGYKEKMQPTLYSTRHQAIANAKRSGLNETEIAAMFGHVSTRTAWKHYGCKNSGWAKTTFRPSQESIAAVGRKHLINIALPDERISQIADSWLNSRK